MQKTQFSEAVIQILKAVPKGKVATYGLVARLAGNPNGSRAVGWLLHSSTNKEKLPWQRIIKSDGKLSFPEGSSEHVLQKKLLIKEGVIVIKGKIDLGEYLWKGGLVQQSKGKNLEKEKFLKSRRDLRK